MRLRGPMLAPRIVGASIAGIGCIFALVAEAPHLDARTMPAEAGNGDVAGRATHVSAGAQELEYVGSRACRRCHLREYRSWQRSKHAAIFDLLAPGVRPEAKAKVNLQPEVDYRETELCLNCHTVGYGTPSGFRSVEETPDLVGVGCETCHGPGSQYILDEVMGDENLDHSFDEVIAAGLIYPVPEEVCTQCHTDPSTPFNPEIFPEYAFEYTRETLEAGSHDHPPLARDHGPLPPGVMFQPDYAGGR